MKIDEITETIFASMKRKAFISIEYANHMTFPTTRINKKVLLKSFVDLVL